MIEDRLSERVILQRIRNRIIEYFEITSSFQRQLAASDPVETIEEWGDWDPWLKEYLPPVFTEPEHRALLAFHAVWENVASQTPVQMPPLEQLIGTPEWERLRAAAQLALEAFSPRGKLSEDQEAPG